jgi:hypothetical protein
MSKKTLVLGASTHPSRYSFIAANMLREYGHEITLVGMNEGVVAGEQIQTGSPKIDEIDTLTLYVSPERQVPMYDYIMSLHPKRIIFNPGTENSALEKLAQKAGIETIEACTLVMLRTGQY